MFLDMIQFVEKFKFSRKSCRIQDFSFDYPEEKDFI